MRERAADVDRVVHERLPSDRDRAGEVHVVWRVPMHERREQDDVVGDGLGGPAADLGGDARVRVDRQVRTVVLERARRDQADAILGRRLPHLGPGQALVEQGCRPGHRDPPPSL
jgi:hypothetical protein